MFGGISRVLSITLSVCFVFETSSVAVSPVISTYSVTSQNGDQGKLVKTVSLFPVIDKSEQNSEFEKNAPK